MDDSQRQKFQSFQSALRTKIHKWQLPQDDPRFPLVKLFQEFLTIHKLLMAPGEPMSLGTPTHRPCLIRKIDKDPLLVRLPDQRLLYVLRSECKDEKTHINFSYPRQPPDISWHGLGTPAVGLSAERIKDTFQFKLPSELEHAAYTLYCGPHSILSRSHKVVGALRINMNFWAP